MSAVGSGSLEARARRLLPLTTILMAALFDLAPIPDGSIASHSPDLMLATVFFWSLHRPELLPPPVLFAAALCSDLAGGALIGLRPLILLVLRQTVVRQQRLLLAANPLVLWLAFASYAGSAELLRWLIASLLSWHVLPHGGAVGDVLLTILSWPLLAMALARVRTMLPKVRHAAGS